MCYKIMRGFSWRRWAWALALCCCWLFVPEKAVAGTEVFEVSKGSATVYNVSIDTTSGSVRVDSPTSAPSRHVKSRFEIEVWNDDAADSLRCAFNVDVSTISSNSNYGREVRPKTGVAWKVPDTIPVYCRVEGSGTAAAAIAVVTQL